jgi:CDP-paratose 2-epimerase
MSVIFVSGSCGLIGSEAVRFFHDKGFDGDHVWYISDVGKFQLHYPEWKYIYTIESMLRETIEAARYK